jgi:hypothetical protein
MMSTPQGVDGKVVERIRKLLALARDGGATEHEAALAMDRAQEIMKANSLSMATIEAGGGTGERRDKQQAAGRAHKAWMRAIMEALAESAFVYVEHAPGRVREDFATGERRKTYARYTLIGRESAVVQTQMMHEYLCKTVVRVARERDDWPNEKFMAGMGERIVERLQQRHLDMLRQQRREADEAKARQPHPGASPGNALVVVLEDFAAQERDLNNDLRRGDPPGTTARERAEREARVAEREREEKRLAELYGDDVAYWMVYADMTLEEAKARVERNEADKALSREAEEARRKSETPEQRARREEREERESAAWRERYRRQEEREAARRSSPSYRAGRVAGDKVGLDTQVGHTERRRLS